MAAPTKEIQTPVGNHKVVLKQWITGRDREDIEAPMLNAVRATPRAPHIGEKKASVDISALDVKSMVQESDHKEITAFVVSVDGKTEGILDTVLDMHEEDTAFIKNAIKELSKKKEQTQTE